MDKYRILFENSISALFINRPDGTILEANQAACDMFGYSVDEFRRIGREGIIDPKSPNLDVMFRNRQKNGHASGELIAIRKNGVRFWCAFSSFIFEDNNGEKLTSVMLIDITDKIAAKEKLELLMNNVPGVVFRYVLHADGSDKLRQVSDGANDVWGVSPESAMQDTSNIWRHFAPGEAERVYQTASKSAETLSSWNAEWRYHHPDGSLRWHRGSGNPVRMDDGSTAWDSIIFDITSEKKVEQEIEESNARYKLVTRATSDAIWDFEPQTGNLFWGEGFYTLFGYDTSKFPKGIDDWLDNIHPDDSAELKSDVDKLLIGPENHWEKEYRFKKTDGTYAFVSDNAIVVRNDHGEPIRVIGAMEDITRRKLRELHRSISTQISQIFNREGTLNEALQVSITAILNLNYFDAAEFWMVDRDRKQINLAAFETKDPGLKVFYEDSNEIHFFKKGVGLPGVTWKRKTNLFWRNLDKRKTFIRRNSAAKAGLNTAYSFPILDEDEVIGVLILLLSEDLKKESYYLNLFIELSKQLVSEINRKRLEEEFVRIFDAAPDGIIVAGFDGYLKKVNPAFCEMLGYSKEEILQTPFIDFVYPEDREITLREYEIANKEGNRSYFENRFVKKSGKVIWLSWTFKVFLEEEVTYSVAKDITEEKELEELLEKANRLAKIGSWEFDLKKEEIYWSDITREIHEEVPGFSPKLSEGIKYYKEGESREIIQKALNELIENKKPWDLELPIITRKGNEKWIRTIGEAEFKDGKPVRLFGSFQDIHDRKVTELQLDLRNRHIHAIANLNSALLNYNEWFEALANHLEMIGKAVQSDRVYYFENRFDPETGEGFTTQKLEWCREGIKPQLNNPDLDEVPFKEVPGLVGPMLNGKPSMVNISDAEKGSFERFVMEDQGIKTYLAIPIIVQGHFHGFVGFDNCTEEVKWSNDEIRTLVTITSNLAIAIERDRSEKALQKAFTDKNEILESIGDGFFTIDSNFYVEYWNVKAEELLFTPREKVLNQYLWDVFDKDLAKSSYEQYSKALKERIELKFEDYYEPINRWFDVNVYPTSNGISVFFKDITERKQAEEQLKELNRTLEYQTRELAASNADLEQFAFVASHDLQEPLRMITSFLTQLERKYDDKLDEKGKKYIYFATDGARRMRQIILDLLDYSRVGRLDSKRELVNLNETLKGVQSLYIKLIEEKKAKVLFAEMPVIYAVKGAMQQLFQNLIHNALRYCQKGSKPEVKVWSEESDSHWKFYIQDNGIGIDPEYKEKIFILFQRLHRSDEYSGTGVGLAVCKKIVEEHDGEIGVDSEPGKGSTFYFTILKSWKEAE